VPLPHGGALECGGVEGGGLAGKPHCVYRRIRLRSIFLLDVLRSGGVRFEEITPVLLEPTEMPPALAEGRIDAMAIWEPQPQVAIDRLGGDAIVLTNPAPDAYFERFGLNTTAAVLANPARRAVLVRALKAITRCRASWRRTRGLTCRRWRACWRCPRRCWRRCGRSFRFTANLECGCAAGHLRHDGAVAAANAKRDVRPAAVLARAVDGSAAREAGL